MGPIILFDKSFLQSLSIDESVWFDHFFYPNVCPIFYVETLADLEKAVREGRTPEEEVGIIASKFPQMHGGPNAHHTELCSVNLGGMTVQMDGTIARNDGHYVKAEGKTGLVFEESATAMAFSRWQKGQFLDVERLFARAWRESLNSINLDIIAENFRAVGIDGKVCKSLKEAKEIAQKIVNSREKATYKMKLAFHFLNIPSGIQEMILKRWKGAGYPPLSDYAPYVAYILTVEIFFQIALAAHLISSERPSNRIDMAYLFYLPFSMLFVSSDRLHRNCAELFLRGNQNFVWGPDLKADLKKLNEYYSSLPEEEKQRGVMSFAGDPPKEGDYLVAKLWDNHFPRWRERKEINITRDGELEKKIVKEANKIADARALQPGEIDFNIQKTSNMVVKRLISKKKGSWWLVSKDLT